MLQSPDRRKSAWRQWGAHLADQSAQDPGRTREWVQDLGAIGLTWGLGLALLGGLQALGYPMGFSVRPIGEDWIWIAYLTGEDGATIAQEYWRVDGRNPLIAWWYVLFRPLLLGVDNALLLLRHVSRLLLAVAVYLALTAVGGRSMRLLALGVALATVLFSATGYRDNLMWAVISVTAVATFSVWCFVRAMRAKTGFWYGVALALWLLVLGSYTLQAGAGFAIALVALWHAARSSRLPHEAALRALRDIWPFAAMFALFVLVWRTTASGFMANSFDVAAFSPSALVRSMALGFWHFDYPQFLNWFGGSLNGSERALVFLIVAGSIYAVLARANRMGAEVPSWGSLIILAVGALCFAAPTIAVETIASQTWYPGSRWRMLHPFWLPVGLVLAATIGGRLIALPAQRRFTVGNALIAGACGALFLVSLGHNEAQVRISAHERALETGLKELVAQETARGAQMPLNIIIKNESPFEFPVAVNPSQAKVWFGGRDIAFRPLFGPGVTAPFAPVRFGPDEEGVDNARIEMTPAGLQGRPAAYGAVRVAAFDGRRLRSLDGSSADAFTGLQVEWARAGPLPTP